MVGYTRLLLDLALLGDFPAFDRHLGELVLLAAKVADPRVTFRATLLSSMRAQASGDFAAAERLITEVGEIAVLVDDLPVSMSLAAHRHHMARMLHDASGIAGTLAGLQEHTAGVPTRKALLQLLAASAHAWQRNPVATADALTGVAVTELAARDALFARLACEAVASAGTPAQAEGLLVLLAKAPYGHCVGGHVLLSYDGPVARLRGLLHLRAGDLPRAESALREALSVARVLGFRPWSARIAFELGEVLQRRARHEEAAQLLSQAEAQARELELPGLVSLFAPSSGAGGRPASASRPSQRLSFAQDGGVWTILVDDRVLHLRDSRGLQLIARLVAQPDRELHVLSLAVDDEGAVPMDVPMLVAGAIAGQAPLDLRGLGTLGGAAVAFLVTDVLAYWVHRAQHRFPWLWRITHQMHHSAERVDVLGASFFHPLDIGMQAAVSTLAVSFLGVTPNAAAVAGLCNVFLAVFQHLNVQTPRWIGWLAQRPEGHSVHHARGVHAYNYGNLSIWDLAFGTFRNPARFEEVAGFYDGASARVGAMLIGRDVGVP